MVPQLSLWLAPLLLLPVLAATARASYAEWTGGETYEEGGRLVVRWVPASEPVLTTTSVKLDAPDPRGHILKFRIKTGGIEPGSLRIRLQMTGIASGQGPSVTIKGAPDNWQEVAVPLEAFRDYRRKLSWNSVEGIGFALSRPPGPDASVSLSDVKIAADVAGPRMTDEELLAALDLTLPELKKVREALASQGTHAALSQFAKHIRTRKSPVWLRDWQREPKPESPSANTIQRAESVLDRYFNPGVTWDKTRFPKKIDWSFNDTFGHPDAERHTVEWNASLNRHKFFPWLSQAYWETGDERYARELVELILDWIHSCPLLLQVSGNSPYHYAWETLNAAVRASSTWWDPFLQCLNSEAMTDRAIIDITKSFHEHAEHLVQWPSRGNWLTAESLGVLCVGTMLPEFKKAQGWRDEAVKRLHGQLRSEVLPDGLQCELALGYNLWVLSEFAHVLELASLNDRMDELPDDFKSHLERMYNYLLYAATPEWTVPGLNDSNTTDIRNELRQGYEMFPHRADFLYGATAGAEGTRPEHTSYAFPYSGHYVMRSGWEADALYLHLDAGPFGAGHQHEDKLSIIVHSGGPKIVDSGNYMYDASRWRKYVLSTRGHNTVRVDSLDQNRRADPANRYLTAPFQKQEVVWETSEPADYAEGFYDQGYGPDLLRVRHTRRVLFVKPDYWVVQDILDPVDSETYTYQSIFHMDAPSARVDPASSAVSLVSDESGFAILPAGDCGKLTIVQGRQEPPEEVQGWSSGPWRAVPTAVFEKRAAGSVSLVYVLLPWDNKGPLPTVEVLAGGGASGAQAAAFRVVFGDGREDTIVLQPTSKAVKADGIETDGVCAFARRNRRTTGSKLWQHGGSYIRKVSE